MRAAGPHSEDMDPELRTVMLGGREEEAAPASGMSQGKQASCACLAHKKMCTLAACIVLRPSCSALLLPRLEGGLHMGVSTAAEIAALNNGVTHVTI